MMENKDTIKKHTLLSKSDIILFEQVFRAIRGGRVIN